MYSNTMIKAEKDHWFLFPLLRDAFTEKLDENLDSTDWNEEGPMDYDLSSGFNLVVLGHHFHLPLGKTVHVFSHIKAPHTP